MFLKRVSIKTLLLTNSLLELTVLKLFGSSKFCLIYYLLDLDACKSNYDSFLRCICFADLEIRSLNFTNAPQKNLVECVFLKT